MIRTLPNAHESTGLVGATLGRFRVIEYLGEGAVGAVYRALDEAGGAVALRVLRAEASSGRRQRQRARFEARIGEKLVHANIAGLIEVGDADGHTFIAMDLVDGTSLRELMSKGPLAAGEAMNLARQIARGLSAGHCAGLICGDLKPEHVVVTGAGQVKLLDFAVGEWGGVDDESNDGEASDATMSVAAKGIAREAPAYLAPEQIRRGAVDARADVFAFGVVLYEMLAGARPFRGATAVDLVVAVMMGSPESLSIVNPGVAAELARIVERCLEKDPADRFEDASTLLAALDHVAVPFHVGASSGERARGGASDSSREGATKADKPVASSAREARSSRREPSAGSGVHDEEITARFEVLGLAGVGGMGEVYRARDRSTGELCAIKLLSAQGGDTQRFAREATVLASIDHEGVVQYRDRGVTKSGAHYLVMEWLSGQDLDACLANGPMSIRDTLAVARKASEALAATHRRGIVHRDVKPANLFLVGGKPDAVKIVDFGLARAAIDDGLTTPGVVLGTLAYMAPEQIRAEPVDARADVYGLGAVLFRCLAGRPPFGGAHRIAVLAKVLVEAPPSLCDLRPEVPAALDALICRMLSKEPALRPSDGAAVLEELTTIAEGAGASPAKAPAIAAREQRVACVVLCTTGSSNGTAVAKQFAAEDRDLHDAVEDRGGVLEVLARGTWLVTIRGAASPAEQAARATRCALAIPAIRPNAPVVVATGRVVVAGDVQVGEVIDRATQGLLAARDAHRNGVRIDEATATLLDDCFEIAGDGAWRDLMGERDAIAPARTLLGRPAACVGRAQELASLAAALAECTDEPRARAMLLTASPGFGKSRLVHEFLRTTVAARRDVQVLFARGDAVRAGSPFGLASQVLRRAAAMLDSDAPAVRAHKLRAMLEPQFAEPSLRRLEELLGEICGVHVSQQDASPGLRAARADAAVMGDALREAWLDWLRARCEAGPILLVLEDLHWADLPSVRLSDAALDALADHAFMVLATSRPEVHTRFPDLWQKRGLQELHLGPLSTRAAERLVREALHGGLDEAKMRALVERAAGHPFHLEELVRAVASGHGADSLPDSVLGMVQARLDLLGTASRRVLRAASVFGETFWSGGVKALVGDDVAADDVAAQLARLAAEEIVTKRPVARLAGEAEYTFRHALVRDAAYAMLTDQDRALAHRLAGSWLEGMGESDAAMLAEHYHRGAAPERALGFFHRAAEQALEGNDFERATAYVERARTCSPDRETTGALAAIQSEVSYWRGELDAAADLAAQAADQLEEGSAKWFDAVSAAVGALGQRGLNDGVAGWLTRAALVDSPPAARGAHAVALCRGMTQLFWGHYRGNLDAVRARFDALASDPSVLDPYQAGWAHRVRAESAWLHDRHVDRCLAEFDASTRAFEAARAHRPLCLTRVNAASLTGWSGDVDRGLDLIAKSRAEATHLGSGFLSLYGLAVTGLLEAYAGRPAAENTMIEALVGLGGSPRLSFVCRIVIGWFALERGDVALAETHARAAVATNVVIDLRPAGLSLLSRVLLAKGQVEEALAEALAAARVRDECADLELMEGMSDLALAEAYEALGDGEAAREALAKGYRRLDAIAQTIGAPEHREKFWGRRLANDRIRARAVVLGLIAD